eukprot:1090354-Prymnesium_polylepis.2
MRLEPTDAALADRPRGPYHTGIVRACERASSESDGARARALCGACRRALLVCVDWRDPAVADRGAALLCDGARDPRAGRRVQGGRPHPTLGPNAPRRPPSDARPSPPPPTAALRCHHQPQHSSRTVSRSTLTRLSAERRVSSRAGPGLAAASPGAAE